MLVIPNTLGKYLWNLWWIKGLSTLTREKGGKRCHHVKKKASKNGVSLNQLFEELSLELKRTLPILNDQLTPYIQAIGSRLIHFILGSPPGKSTGTMQLLFNKSLMDTLTLCMHRTNQLVITNLKAMAVDSGFTHANQRLH